MMEIDLVDRLLAIVYSFSNDGNIWVSLNSCLLPKDMKNSNIEKAEFLWRFQVF